MKVLQVNKLYYPHIGGVEIHVRDLAVALHPLVDVKVLTANTRFATVRELIDGVEVIKVASLGRLQSAPLAPSFPLWLRKMNADIYHFHFPYPPGELSFLLAQIPGKLVVTYHSDIVRQRFLLTLYRPFLRRFLSRARSILAFSPNLIAHSFFLQEFKKKCQVIPYGIDLKVFKLTPEEERKVKEIKKKYGSNLILFVGRLIYYKGLSYLLEAMKGVKGTLLVAGEGNLREALEKKARETGIENKVHFLGEASDRELIILYHACDFLVLPSIAESEAFGRVQLEAHACGKPVVSTNLPTGVPYANVHEKTGLVVPPKDSLALAKALNTLLTEDFFRKKLGIQAKKRVETSFTYKAMAEAVMKVYEEVLRPS